MMMVKLVIYIEKKDNRNKHKNRKPTITKLITTKKRKRKNPRNQW
jgi:hypothetical protein